MSTTGEAATSDVSAMPPPEAPALRLRTVTFGYRTPDPVVEGISGELGPGRLCALIGPNAAGKSTLLKLMLGQLVPWAGDIAVEGRDVAAMTALERARRMAYVPQRGAVGFAFSVREVIEMGRFAGGRDVEAVERAIGACDLGTIIDRPFVELSGGQQQRVLVARALAQIWGRGSQGRLLLLDEPTSSLDLCHVHGLMGVLREQVEAGLAVLVVLHDLNLAARYADDVWLMQDGRVAAAGGWRQVMDAARLSAVYGVPLQGVYPDESGRPVFIAQPAVTLDGE